MFKFFNRIPLRSIPELDSIRFFCIFLVVLHHQAFENNAFLQWFTDHGWIGVDVFFGMSGYLITGLLLKGLAGTSSIDLKNFWFKRMLRLWPSWIFTLVLSFLMVYFISRNTPVVREALTNKWWHYFLHFGNYSYIFEGKIHTLYSHFWSLAVEEHFYVLWPLVLLSLKTRRSLIFGIWFMIATSLGFRLYHLSQGASVHLLSFSTHTRMDQLLMGCLLALLTPSLKRLRASVEVFLTALTAALYFLGLYVLKDHPASIYYAALTYSVVGIATCLLIVLATKGSQWGIRAVLSNPVLARLGVLSYGVYLIHLHVNYLVFPFFKRYPLVQDENWLALINLVVPFVPAYFMYFYLDEYFARYKPTRAAHLQRAPEPTQGRA